MGSASSLNRLKPLRNRRAPAEPRGPFAGVPAEVASRSIQSLNAALRCEPVSNAPNTVAHKEKPKMNSGFAEQWQHIVSPDGLLMLPDTETGPRLNRDGVHKMLSEALAHFQVHSPVVLSPPEASPVDPQLLVMHQEAPSLFGADLRWQAPNVRLIKMWGFAGMSTAEDIFGAYGRAVEALMKQAPPSDNVPSWDQSNVVLQFDGDPAFEKVKPDSPTVKKFTHAALAPFVAAKIKEAFPGHPPKVHLLIVKVDDGAPQKIAQKFCDAAADAQQYVMRTSPDDRPEEHTYPLFDKPEVLDSVTIVLKSVDDTHGSEFKIANICDQLMTGVASKHCICVGGNTDPSPSASSPQGVRAFGERPWFNTAVRARLNAFQPDLKS